MFWEVGTAVGKAERRRAWAFEGLERAAVTEPGRAGGPGRGSPASWGNRKPSKGFIQEAKILDESALVAEYFGMAEVRGREAMKQDAGLHQESSSKMEPSFKDAEKVTPTGCGLGEWLRESMLLKMASVGVPSPAGLGARQTSSVLSGLCLNV